MNLPQHPTKSDSDSDADLLTLLDRFADAWNRHDLDALMSMMTDDCVFEASAGPEVDGQRSEGTAGGARRLRRRVRGIS